MTLLPGQQTRIQQPVQSESEQLKGIHAASACLFRGGFTVQVIRHREGGAKQARLCDCESDVSGAHGTQAVAGKARLVIVLLQCRQLILDAARKCGQGR
jgi:hypothetical protein